jgi:hypothetical protein
VIRRDVQGVEVGPLELDLGALGHLVAHAHEQIGDALHEGGDRVPGAARPPVARQRHVDRLLDQNPAGPVLLEHGQPGVVRLLDRRPRLVDPLAGVGARLRRERPDLPPGQGHRGPVAQVLVAQRDQTVHVGHGRERLLRGGDRLIQRRLVQQRHLLGVVRVAAPAHDRPHPALVIDALATDALVIDAPVIDGGAGRRWAARCGVTRAAVPGVARYGR